MNFNLAPRTVLLSLAFIGYLTATSFTAFAQRISTPPFDGRRAMTYLESICAIGPRISGSTGMLQQQELLEKHFSSLGARIHWQDFDIPHPKTGEPVRMRNLIVSWDPTAPVRKLICCHYDTRPMPDREPTEEMRNKPFIGANDGASGLALMMELGNQFAALEKKPAVDFVIFDGEELVYSQDDKYFHGSEYFAKTYASKSANDPSYSQGVLLDMVAGQNAKFYYEVNSLRYAPAVTHQVWDVARRLGLKDFVAQRKHEVLDDHLPLNQIARIPTCDIIDFDYPHWHRRNDLPAACSAGTLHKVGIVVSAWSQLPDAAGSR